ncbi:MAG TPA: HAMP domain-containing sensor histidine kinase [Holophagaceae bacterium]|nr:HAMP domain-containing sensor histidine kinase [Holophagaceae bacterium]
MARRTFTRFRTLPRLGSSGGPASAFLSSSSTLVLWLVGLALGAFLVYYPRVWAKDQLREHGQPWVDAQWALLDRIERDWQTLVVPPPFTEGSEAEVKAYLDQNPLVEALKERGSEQLWIRRDTTLLPAIQHPLGVRYLGWFQMAEQAPTFQWFPPKALNPDQGRVAVTILTTNRWMILKRWELGGAQVEKHLQKFSSKEAPVRVGLWHADLSIWKGPQPWGAWPHLQIDPYRIDQRFTLSQDAATNAYGEGWSMSVYPSLPGQREFFAYYHRKLSLAYGLAILLGLSVAGAALMRARARQRAALESDRLASLTHSLKTPLAILKFRCDSLRLGRLSPDQTDEQLLRLGAEVDHLTLVIDSGLRAIKGDEETGPASEASPAFLREVALDLEPAFESENRELELNLCDASGEASLSTLRSALATLLENALAHGGGKVVMETRRHRGTLAIVIRDHGAGLTADELEALGKPFQRFRTSAAEGFKREGLGLGLSLLIQMAEREGWGLSFDSIRGQGLSVELRIRLHGGRGLWRGLLNRLESRSLPVPLESK